MERCPHCEREFPDNSRDRIFNHIYGAHGKTKAKKYKKTWPEELVRDTEAEYIISRMGA